MCIQVPNGDIIATTVETTHDDPQVVTHQGINRDLLPHRGPPTESFLSMNFSGEPPAYHGCPM